MKVLRKLQIFEGTIKQMSENIYVALAGEVNSIRSRLLFDQPLHL